MSKKPTVLMILDGYGLNDNCEHNAVCEGKTPVMDQLMSQCPFVKGEASGMAVGLPEGQMGNSEVGHLNMGAGRIVYQELTRITKSIQDGGFFRIPEFITAVENCKKHDSALHMFGLVSDGGVHSHNTHIYGLLELAKKNGLKKEYVHCFLDGRDTPPESGKGIVEQLEAKMKEIGIGEAASVMGRYYAMDRDKRWDRVEQAYNALTKGEGNQAESAAALKECYIESLSLGSNTIEIDSEDGSASTKFTVSKLEEAVITLLPKEAEVKQGDTLQFTAEITGIDDKSVIRNIEGAKSENTHISEWGLLSVGEDETAKELLVKVVAKEDNTLSALAKVLVKNKETLEPGEPSEPDDQPSE